MVRILHIVPTLDINAGMMSVIMNYYRRVNREKLQFDFLSLSQAQLSHREEISALGGRVFYLGEVSFSGSYIKKIRAFFDEHRGEYTAVHCHPIWGALLFGPSAKKAEIKHIIAHSHSTRFSEKKVSAIRNRLMMPPVLSIATDLVACCTDAAKKQFGTTKNVFIMRNAVEPEKYFFNEEQRKKIRAEFSVDEGDFVIGHAGRFSVEKNHSFMLKAFSQIKKELPGAKLLLAGDGVLLEQTKQLAAELRIESSVIFAGKRRDISALLSAMDAFWLPSTFEGVPLSVIEAQASGLPCVLSSAVTRDVNLGCCTYFDLSAPEKQWATAFSAIAEKKPDRTALGAKLKGGCFDIESQAKGVFDYYMTLQG